MQESLFFSRNCIRETYTGKSCAWHRLNERLAKRPINIIIAGLVSCRSAASALKSLEDSHFVYLRKSFWRASRPGTVDTLLATHHVFYLFAY